MVDLLQVSIIALIFVMGFAVGAVVAVLILRPHLAWLERLELHLARLSSILKNQVSP